MNLIPTNTRPVTITLYRGVPFDNSYKEHTLFSTQFAYQQDEVGNPKDSFLDLKEEDNTTYIYPRTTKEGTFNFAYGNGLVTSVVLELNGEEINSNYMKVTIRETLPVRYISYYYFITGIIQKNEYTYLLNLELDVFQTFGDVFLNNMQDKPVMVERKHCSRVDNNGKAFCGDLVKSESMFAGVKTNIVDEILDLLPHPLDHNGDYVPLMNWIYIIVKEPSESASDVAINFSYKENGIDYPYIVKCFPLCSSYEILDKNGQTAHTGDIRYLIRCFASSDKVAKIVIKPYPPFKNADNIVFLYQPTYDRLVFKLTDYTYSAVTEWNIRDYLVSNDGQCMMSFVYKSAQAQLSETHGITLQVGYGGKIQIGQDEYNLFPNNKVPSLSNLKDTNEMKLELPPFKRQYVQSLGTEGNEIPLQLRLNGKPGNNWNKFKFYQIISSNPDNSFSYTYCDMQDYDGDILTKTGDGGSLNYLLPTGANAYEHFMETANAEYTQSKIVSSLSNMVKIGAGVGALALASTGVGAVAGVAGIASGVIGIGNDITSYYSKMEDLKNTANTFNLGGTSFSRDYAMAKAVNTNMFLYPYKVTYVCDECIIHSASDYFYEYGYEVNRDCYFNTQLYLGTASNRNICENNIFTRTLFNFVKIRDDITTKCVSNELPYIIAKKFNDIFNKGIKLWTFFGFNDDCFEAGYITEDSIYNPFRYFQKHTYDNAEFYNQQEE